MKELWIILYDEIAWCSEVLFVGLKDLSKPRRKGWIGWVLKNMSN